MRKKKRKAKSGEKKGGRSQPSQIQLCKSKGAMGERHQETEKARGKVRKKKRAALPDCRGE